MTTSNYLFDNAAEREAAARMTALSAQHNEATFRLLGDRGIAPGWKCLEIGAGDGSVARWMAGKVGPSGHVLATDIDPRFTLRHPAGNPDNMEVRIHDITTGILPSGEFDLIHARLVLVWLPARISVLGRLNEALKPGGWLVIEDYDTKIVGAEMATADPHGAGAFARMKEAMFTLMTKGGLGHAYARDLHHRLREHRLIEVGQHASFDVFNGGSAGADLQKANFSQVRRAVVDAGLISDADVAEVLRLLDDPSFTAFTPVMISAWGRKPVAS
jgi:SAM-dependent methyltransferase